MRGTAPVSSPEKAEHLSPGQIQRWPGLVCCAAVARSLRVKVPQHRPSRLESGALRRADIGASERKALTDVYLRHRSVRIGAEPRKNRRRQMRKVTALFVGLAALAVHLDDRRR